MTAASEPVPEKRGFALPSAYTILFVLIVLLVLFARAPEDHERSGASVPTSVTRIAA